MVGHGGQHRPDVVHGHLGAEPEDERDAPATGFAQPVLEEVRDVRRNRRIPNVTGRIGEPAGAVPGGQRGRQRGHTLVFEQVLRRQVQTFLGQVRRDTDGAHRIAAEFEEVGVAVDRVDTQRLGPDALQCRFDLLLPAAGRILATGTVGRGGRRRRVGREGPVRLLDGPFGINPMPLARKRIAGQGDAIVADRPRAGATSRRRLRRTRVARGRAGRRRGRLCSGVGDASAERRGVGLTTAADVSPTPSNSRPGPTSTRTRSGSASNASSSSENLTVALICRAHRAGSVASSADIQVPVVFDKQRCVRLAQLQPGKDVLEFRQHGIHGTRMERMRCPHPTRGQSTLGKPLLELTHARPRIRTPRSCPDR